MGALTEEEKAAKKRINVDLSKVEILKPDTVDEEDARDDIENEKSP